MFHPVQGPPTGHTFLPDFLSTELFTDHAPGSADTVVPAGLCSVPQAASKPLCWLCLSWGCRMQSLLGSKNGH